MRVTTGVILLVSSLAVLGAGPVAAKRPAVSPVGSPCFCGKVCQSRGVTHSVWTDPAGAQVSLDSCPAANAQDAAQSGGLCNCGNPLDWYRLWREMAPPQPNRTSPNH